jgi:hypothetical protein
MSPIIVRYVALILSASTIPLSLSVPHSTCLGLVKFVLVLDNVSSSAQLDEYDADAPVGYLLPIGQFCPLLC